MTDSTNQNAQNQKSGRTGVEDMKDQSGKHAATPTDKGTPRVDQSHDKSKGSGSEGHERDSSHVPGQERRPGRDADADRASPGGSSDSHRGAKAKSMDDSDSEAGDPSKSMKPNQSPSNDRAKSDQSKR